MAKQGKFSCCSVEKWSTFFLSKYSARSAYYLGMIFINRERLHYLNQNSIFKLKIEIFQTSDWEI